MNCPDEDLLPIDNEVLPIASVAKGVGLLIGRVCAGFRFGKALSGQAIARKHGSKEALLLLFSYEDAESSSLAAGELHR